MELYITAKIKHVRTLETKTGNKIFIYKALQLDTGDEFASAFEVSSFDEKIPDGIYDQIKLEVSSYGGRLSVRISES